MYASVLSGNDPHLLECNIELNMFDLFNEQVKKKGYERIRCLQVLCPASTKNSFVTWI